MILDINAYIGRWPYWPLRSTTATEVAAELGAWGIERAAICSTRSIFIHCDDGNCEAEQAVRQHPGVFVPFACLGTLELSHQLPDREHDLAPYAERGFRGIRLYPQHHSYHPLYEDFVDAILEQAAARRWPVLLPLRLIMNWGMPMLDLGVIEALVERHPSVLWILAGINYLHELQLATKLMKRNPNVHLETSCVMGFEAIVKLAQRCGSEQILFGSGAPVQHGAAGLQKILQARLTDAQRDDILGGNAARLLRLNEQ